MWQRVKLGVEVALGITLTVIGLIVMLVILLFFGLLCTILFSGVALGSAVCNWLSPNQPQEYTLPQDTQHGSR